MLKDLYLEEPGDLEEVELFTFERIVRLTEKAILFELEDGEQRWIPRSQLRQDFENLIYVTKWFLENV